MTLILPPAENLGSEYDLFFPKKYIFLFRMLDIEGKWIGFLVAPMQAVFLRSLTKILLIALP